MLSWQLKNDRYFCLRSHSKIVVGRDLSIHLGKSLPWNILGNEESFLSHAGNEIYSIFFLSAIQSEWKISFSGESIRL